MLSLVAGGETNREIAAHLFISENTVKEHLSNILHKLQLKNRSQLAAYATSGARHEGLPPVSTQG